MHSLGSCDLVVSEQNEGHAIGLLLEVLQVLVELVLLETAVLVAVEVIVDLVKFGQGFLGNGHTVFYVVGNSLFF